MKTNPLKWQEILDEQEADSALVDLLPTLEGLLPSGVQFEMDTWDLLPWVPRKGKAKSFNVSFHKINNTKLKILIKIYFLEKRQRFSVSANSLTPELHALLFLDKTLGMIPVDKITNAFFYDTQDLIVANSKATAASRYANFLEAFGRWLSLNFGYRISYKNTLPTVYAHGRKASDENKQLKLIDTRITIDLIAALHNEDLSKRDEFYLLILVIFIGTGFRINELTSLPVDCLIQEGDNLGIRFFPLKKPKLDIHWIVGDWANPIKDAVNRLVEFTHTGRLAAAEVRKNPGINWSSILQNAEAAEYFVAKFCHEWTANPSNHMYNNAGAWFEKEKRYIDMIGLVQAAGSMVQVKNQLGYSRDTISYLHNAQQAALNNQLPPTVKGKATRDNWDKDSRVISMLQLENHINLKINREFKPAFAHIIDDARDNYQLRGEIYPCPPHEPALEKAYQRVINSIIDSRNGGAILQPEDLLLITQTYQLSDTHTTKSNDFSIITDTDIQRWLTGSPKSQGTKSPQDSCFSRLGIIDPKTGKTAKFTSHDVRHWLNTYLKEGGMPNDQVALLFNRTPSQNDTYDHTPFIVRLSNIRQAIRDGGAMGHIAETYELIADTSRKDAEEYLKAATLFLNLMPHGGCTLNWGVKACKNHNACFNGSDGVCEHLCIDHQNPETSQELDRMMLETETALEVIPTESPQYEHYQNIQRNLKQLNQEK